MQRDDSETIKLILSFLLVEQNNFRAAWNILVTYTSYYREINFHIHANQQTLRVLSPNISYVPLYDTDFPQPHNEQRSYDLRVYLSVSRGKWRWPNGEEGRVSFSSQLWSEEVSGFLFPFLFVGRFPKLHDLSRGINGPFVVVRYGDMIISTDSNGYFYAAGLADRYRTVIWWHLSLTTYGTLLND